eukprot:SAG31_NODE_3003_length_4795_cov_4.386499_3_plen_66_part_00
MCIGQGVNHVDQADMGVQIRAAPLGHTVPCVGYVLDEEDKPGSMDAAKARSTLLQPETVAFWAGL